MTHIWGWNRCPCSRSPSGTRGFRCCKRSSGCSFFRFLSRGAIGHLPHTSKRRPFDQSSCPLVLTSLLLFKSTSAQYIAVPSSLFTLSAISLIRLIFLPDAPLDKGNPMASNIQPYTQGPSHTAHVDSASTLVRPSAHRACQKMQHTSCRHFLYRYKSLVLGHLKCSMSLMRLLSTA